MTIPFVKYRMTEQAYRLYTKMDHEYFMEKALAAAKKALDAGEFPVGCVIVSNKKIITNGFRKGTMQKNARNEIDHAEILTLRRLSELHIDPIPNDITLYCTMEPCLMCFGAILLSGIRTIVYAYEDVMGGGTRMDLSALSPFYGDIQLTIIPHILRDKSLRLFQTYFSNPENTYWKGSPLEQYTMNQK